MKRLHVVTHSTPAPPDPIDAYEGAKRIADCMEEVAAAIVPVNDPVRAAAIRGAVRWRTIAGTRPIKLDPSIPLFRPEGDDK